MGGPGQSFTNNNGPVTPTTPVTAGAHLLACLVGARAFMS